MQTAAVLNRITSIVRARRADCRIGRSPRASVSSSKVRDTFEYDCGDFPSGMRMIPQSCCTSRPSVGAAGGAAIRHECCLLRGVSFPHVYSVESDTGVDVTTGPSRSSSVERRPTEISALNLGPSRRLVAAKRAGRRWWTFSESGSTGTTVRVTLPIHGPEPTLV